MSAPDNPAAPQSVPDLPFSLFGAPSAADDDAPAPLADRIGARLAALAPDGWTRADAVFALTVAAEVAHVFHHDDEKTVTAQPDSTLLGWAREHRADAGAAGEPWWRMAVSVTPDGVVAVDYDHGERPFPAGYLLPPSAYRADLQAFPRARLPIWLAAYLNHADRQARPPGQAARAARHDRAESARPVRVRDDELPPLPLVWSRWATLAAAFAAVGATAGPRLRPAVAWYEDPSGGGASLCLLPRGRAVLSGGQWAAPVLDLVYNDGRDMPNFYAGAPDWVTDTVLNPRAAQGLLSFCYWWDDDTWHRGTWSSAADLTSAVPPVDTARGTADVIAGLVDPEPSADLRLAASRLVAAAAAESVTLDLVAAVFDPGRTDTDGAMHQLTLAGVTAAVVPPLPRDEAVGLVREYFGRHQLDSTEYPLEALDAERISVGWLVCSPVAPDAYAFGRALFYVADDGVVERSSSSVAPQEYTPGFERRFRQRRRV